jgi:hypothetical protein
MSVTLSAVRLTLWEMTHARSRDISRDVRPADFADLCFERGRRIRAHRQRSAPESFDISRDRKGGGLVGDKAYRDIVASHSGKPRGRRAYATASTFNQKKWRLKDGLH